MARKRGNGNDSDGSDSSDKSKKDSDNNNNNNKRPGKKESRKKESFTARQEGNNTTALLTPPSTDTSEKEKEYLSRIVQLEKLVAQQTVAIRKLQQECADLKEASAAFAHVMDMLRSAGLETDKFTGQQNQEDTPPKSEKISKDQSSEAIKSKKKDSSKSSGKEEPILEYEYFDDTEIFGEAPSSVIDAADAAGAAILAGLLGGKQRMLVDVRDSELSRDPDTLVQFIELAILPVAAGLEGLKSNRNRVKIVFPTVSQLLEYRRTMALAAPEVVALSTLGFDPVEDRDNLVVIVAPAPDNDEGFKAMNELLEPPEWKKEEKISQPVVVLNHHMVPLSGPAADYDVMYHLRLLSVQYMSGDSANALFRQFGGADDSSDDGNSTVAGTGNSTADNPDDEILEAAMQHAYETGVNQGQTRAMVIRAYPKYVVVRHVADFCFVILPGYVLVSLLFSLFDVKPVACFCGCFAGYRC